MPWLRNETETSPRFAGFLPAFLAGSIREADHLATRGGPPACIAACNGVPSRVRLSFLVMQVQINGEPRDVPVGSTISAVIALLELAGRAVAVEVNKQLVPKRQHETTKLNEGDVVEIVTLVGGG